MTDVASWKHRLATMDHTKGTSNKMRETSMLAEIGELRKTHMAATVQAKVQTRRADHWKDKYEREVDGAVCSAAASRKEAIRATKKISALAGQVAYWKAKSKQTMNMRRALESNQQRVKELMGFTRKYQKQLRELRK